MDLTKFINLAIAEDVGAGDFTSLSCIDASAIGKAKLIVKESGVLAGVDFAEQIAIQIDNDIRFNKLKQDGHLVVSGDIAFTLSGKVQSILKAERILLNCMQRMSGIATITQKYVDAVTGTNAKILDTRKTTPLNRYLEKWAVRIGGGYNHRFGLFDMIMIKDNHVDFAGGIRQAIEAAYNYTKQNNLDLKIEIETRSLDDVVQVLETGKVDRIMFDNFEPELMQKAVTLVNGKYETEASGGIVLETIRRYAETGVDFISVGALTHSVKSLDISLKAY